MTDDEIKAAYERPQGRPTTRPSGAASSRSPSRTRRPPRPRKKAIAGGKSFADAAKEAGAKESDIDLGLLTEGRLIDPKIADAAFSLDKDKVSDAGRGPLRHRAPARRPRSSPASQAHLRRGQGPGARQARGDEGAPTQMQELHDEVEDDARGRQVAEGDRRRAEAPVPRDRRRPTAGNKTPDGKPAIEHPGRAEGRAQRGLRRRASASRASRSSWPTAATPGSTCSASRPQKQKPFDEVKAEVKDADDRQRSARASSPSWPTSWSSAPTRARRWRRSPREAGAQGRDDASRSRAPPRRRA